MKFFSSGKILFSFTEITNEKIVFWPAHDARPKHKNKMEKIFQAFN